jgi:hypothetical protein
MCVCVAAIPVAHKSKLDILVPKLKHFCSTCAAAVEHGGGYEDPLCHECFAGMLLEGPHGYVLGPSACPPRIRRLPVLHHHPQSFCTGFLPVPKKQRLEYSTSDVV